MGVDQLLIYTGQSGNPVHASRIRSFFGKFHFCGIQNFLPGKCGLFLLLHALLSLLQQGAEQLRFPEQSFRSGVFEKLKQQVGTDRRRLQLC